MSTIFIAPAVELFDTRLSTLQNLLRAGETYFSENEHKYLNRRLAPDMLPLGTQVAFTCNQPRNFALWLNGSSASDIDPNIESLRQAMHCIQETRDALGKLGGSGREAPKHKYLELGSESHAELTGFQYLNDFLIPNFYFHLVTSYAILRMSGVPIGKRDYMLHLIPHVKQR